MLNLKQRTNNSVQLPDDTDAALFLNDDEKLVLKNDAGVIETIATVEGLAAAEPKVYLALLTQSGTEAPEATVLKNTLGGTVVWSFNDVGRYIGTLASAFTFEKTSIFIANPDKNAAGSTGISSVSISSVNTITVLTFDSYFIANNSLLFGTPISIEVYP